MWTLEFCTYISVLEILWSTSHWKMHSCGTTINYRDYILHLMVYWYYLVSTPKNFILPWNKWAYLLQNLLAAIVARRTSSTILFKRYWCAIIHVFLNTQDRKHLPSSLKRFKESVEWITHKKTTLPFLLL